MKYYWLCLGVGMICLDFKGVYIILDGFVISMGKSINFISGYISFLYNEYFLFRKFNIFFINYNFYFDKNVCVKLFYVGVFLVFCKLGVIDLCG